MEIDLSAIPIDNPVAFAWWFFKTIGWIFPVFLIMYGSILGWQLYIRSLYRKQRKYVLLAVDIPKDNEQTLRAVENFFSHMSGAHQPLKWHHLWWRGEVPDSFGFEIVSIGGYIQYIIHCVDIYRDFVEAAIYAQYPGAEITEVEDYTERWKDVKFPNEHYQLFGTELKLTNKEVYPIITYKEFEDSLSQELKDPLAGVLEAMGKIGPEEELWLQILITPADNDWGKAADPVIQKLIGAKVETKKSLLDYIFDIPGIIMEGINPPAEGTKSKDAFGNEPPNKLLYMTKGEQEGVAAIQNKTGKIGFHTRVRWIYIAPKEKYRVQKALHTLYGAFKQYNTLGLNGFKNDTRYLTAAIVFFKKTRLNIRRNRILYRYRWRGHWFAPGEYGFILNTEELASLWHFPMITVKAPLLSKTEAKKAEPPITLPREIPQFLPDVKNTDKKNKKAGPPDNLPT